MAARQLPVPKEMREASNWCWAAVAVCVTRYYEKTSTLTQCQLADSELSPATSCCVDKNTAECNRLWKLDSALKEHFSPPKAGVLSLAECVTQVCDLGRPIGVRIRWFGTQIGHFILITGVDDQAEQQLTIWDPSRGIQHFDHALFSTNYHEGEWTDSYLTK